MGKNHIFLFLAETETHHAYKLNTVLLTYSIWSHGAIYILNRNASGKPCSYQGVTSHQPNTLLRNLIEKI